MKFQKMKIDPPRLYWTSRKTDFDKEIWYEKSPGVCDSMWFPYATYFLGHFPKIAVRVFWLMIKMKKIWNAFVTNYPNPYPDLLNSQTDSGDKNEN